MLYIGNRYVCTGMFQKLFTAIQNFKKSKEVAKSNDHLTKLDVPSTR